MRRQAIKIICMITTTLILSSCGLIYRPTIEQGNDIKAQDIKLLHQGMTSNQITNALGNPVAVNTFSNQNLVYVYTFNQRGKRTIKRFLRITLKNGRMIGYKTNIKTGSAT